MTTHEILLITLFLLLLGGILTGIPVSIVLIGIPTLIAFFGAAIGAFDLTFLNAFPARAFGLLTNPVLLSVPLFVLMGGMLEKSDIARKMMLTAGALFGKRRGGMAYAVVIVGALLAASTGVIGATIYMLGMIALPAMLRANYSPRLAAGVICSSGTLGQIIPPSILLILLADQISTAYQAGRRAAGEWAVEPVSVGDLFAGALLPGLLLVGLYLAYIFLQSRINPESCPPVDISNIDELQGDKLTFKSVFSTLVLPLLLIVLVLGSILGGVATPTESAALGAGGALIMVALQAQNLSRFRRFAYYSVLAAAVVLVALKAITGGAQQSEVFSPAMIIGAIALICFLLGFGLAVEQEFRNGDLLEVSRGTVLMVAMMVLIVLGATMLSIVFRGLGGDEIVSELLSSLPGGTVTALIVVMAVIFALGFVLEYIEIIFIVVPVAGPPLMQAGVDPIWFAILISMNLQMSFLTPPFGYALFYLRNVASDLLSTKTIYASIIPFVLLQIIALALVAFFPEIATWLPTVLY